MGQIYVEQKKEALLTEAFSYFYAAINIGSAVSTLALPMIREKLIHAGHSREYAYAVTLMIPAVLMAVAFVAFAIGKRHYPIENVRELPARTPEQKQAERQTLARIAGIFSLIAVFWFVYDQSASTWIYFANRHMDLHLFGSVTTTADQIQGFNPVFIVVLTPVFNAMWEWLKRRRGGVDVPDTRKMLLGFIIVVVCMAMMAMAGFLAGGGMVSVWWMVIATFVITLSELCISVVGLEFAFRQAAPGTKSVVTAAFLFTVFVGDTAGGFFDKLLWGKVSSGNFFLIQTVIMVATAVVFIGIARKFERSEGTERLEPAHAA